jgi:hypothetical protein
VLKKDLHYKFKNKLVLTLSLLGGTNSKEIDTLGEQTVRKSMHWGFFVRISWFFATELKL